MPNGSPDFQMGQLAGLMKKGLEDTEDDIKELREVARRVQETATQDRRTMGERLAVVEAICAAKVPSPLTLKAKMKKGAPWASGPGAIALLKIVEFLIARFGSHPPVGG